MASRTVSDFLVIDASAAYTPDERIPDARILVRSGRIASIESRSRSEAPPGDYIDARELIAAPGFVDPHVHGAGGVDVMEGAWEALDRVSRVLARHGTTSFLAATVSESTGFLDQVFTKLGRLVGPGCGGAELCGVHMEGPFLNAARRGCHREAHLRPPDRVAFERWFEASAASIRVITLAPELEGAREVIDAALDRGVVVAVGHSDASESAARAAVDAGARYAVHTFNAMRELRHRDPGIAGAVLSDDRVWAEIIADGVHVAPSLVKVFARAKGPARVVLATDGTSATGMPDGRYRLGSEPIELSGGVCRDPEGRLAGSALTQDVALRNFMRWTGFPLEDALPAVTSNPARAAGISGAGSLAPGGRADLVLLDCDHHVVETYVQGRRVYPAASGGQDPRERQWTSSG